KAWTAIRNACIRLNNYKIFGGVTIDVCKEKCLEELGMNCQSIDYEITNQRCLISKARSNSADFTEPCYDGIESAYSEILQTPPSPCPEGFFPSAGQCFKFFVGWQKWTSARSTCGRNQLRMAEPKDPVAVRAYLNAHYAGQGDASWIGGRGVGSHFEWIGSKTRINDAYWAPGQPDGEGTSYEYCLRFSPSTLPNADKPFYSNPCRKVFNVLCELHGILAHSAELDGFYEDQGLVEESAQGIENSIEDLCSKMNGRCVDSKDKCSALQPMRIYNVSFPQITQKYCPFSIPYTDSPACCAPSGQVFTADIENALAFTFENTLIYNSWEVETGRIPVNYTEPVRNELRGFLMILDKYLKAPNHIHSHTKEFIGTVKRYVGDHSFSASELQQEFKDIQERRGGDVYLSAWQPSVSCHNINKGTCYNNSYLASCGLWNMFHTITVSANDPAKPLEVIQAIRGFIHDLFFCGLCRHHFLGMYKQTITKYDSVNTLDEAILWLWCAHNAVNEEWTDWQSNNHLGGWPRHPQFPLTEACPDCWPGSLGGEYHTCATLFCHGNTEPGKCFSAQFNHTTTPVIYHRFSIPHVLTYLKDVYSGPYSKLNSRKNKLIFREDITCPH
ncbi:unnamed protein product, partial [Meganyctiphanes norvegica]